MALEEIQTQLGGKWKLDRSENFDEFLKELGLNVVFRKMAGAAKPVIEIKIENETVNIVSKVSFFNQVISFKLDEPYQQNYEGLEMNCMSRWENGKIITEANPVAEGKGKPQKFVREITNEELVQTMYVGDVKCTRVFKRTSE